MANVSIAAFDSFFFVKVCSLSNFDRSEAVLKDHLFAMHIKLTPLFLY